MKVRSLIETGSARIIAIGLLSLIPVMPAEAVPLAEPGVQVVLTLPSLKDNADHYRLQVRKEHAGMPSGMETFYTDQQQFAVTVTPEWDTYSVTIREVDRYGVSSPESPALVFTYDEIATGVGKIAGQPATFALMQNSPNPFNPVTTIAYSLLSDGWVKLAVYNIAGQEVSVLEDRYLEAGTHTFVWNAAGMPSGTYFYRLTATGYTNTRKMMLLK